MRRLAFLVPMLACSGAISQEAAGGPFELHFGGVSHHWRHDDEHNDLNLGLGLEYRFSADLGVIAGYYQNSNHKPSEYALLRYQPLHLGPVQLGGLAGVVNGYDRDDGARANGAAMLAASVDLERLNVSLVGMPSVGRRVDGCVSLQFGWRL